MKWIIGIIIGCSIGIGAAIFFSNSKSSLNNDELPNSHHEHGSHQHNQAITSPNTQITDSVKPYPLDKCLISGEKLGSMGDPFVMIHADQEIKFCCKGCVKDFKKDPESYLRLLKE